MPEKELDLADFDVFVCWKILVLCPQLGRFTVMHISKDFCIFQKCQEPSSCCLASAHPCCVFHQLFKSNLLLEKAMVLDAGVEECQFAFFFWEQLHNKTQCQTAFS